MANGKQKKIKGKKILLGVHRDAMGGLTHITFNRLGG